MLKFNKKIREGVKTRISYVQLDWVQNMRDPGSLVPRHFL